MVPVGTLQGRPRPPLKARALQCTSCGSPLSVKDEHARFVVCDACGTHLSLSETDLKSLGRGPKPPVSFHLKVGDRVTWDAVKYEVMARMAFTEDDDLSELTREYYLFHPRRGVFWLSEYQGQWSFSRDTHVKPRKDPFSCRPGTTIPFHDNRKWVVEESGTYKLIYVDGALPWQARVGDLTHYVDLVDEEGKGLEMEASRHGTEVEYSTGAAVPVERIRAATGKRDLEGRSQAGPSVTAGTVSAFVKDVSLVALMALAVHGLLWFWASDAGYSVLDQSFRAEELTTQVLSDPFTLAKGSHVVKVELRAPNLDNEWVAVDLGLVKEDDQVVHVFDSDLEYYHGVEGGESWSEGSHSADAWIKVPEGGTYRLLLHAVSGAGETTTSEVDRQPLQVRVVDRARVPFWSLLGLGVSAVTLLLTLIGYYKWQKRHEDDDD